MIQFITRMPVVYKKLILFGIDGIIIPLSLWAALSLRYGELFTGFSHPVSLVFIGLTVLTLFFFVSIGLHRAVLRYAGPQVLETIGLGVLGSTGILVLLSILIQDQTIPRSVYLIYGAILFVLVTGARVLALKILGVTKSRNNRKPAAIYGAGEVGRRLASILHAGKEYQAVCFLDDDLNLDGREVDGKKVFHPGNKKCLEYLRKNNVKELMLAIPSMSKEEKRVVIKKLEPFPCRVRSVPDYDQIVSGQAQLDQLEEIDLEDLLGRDSVACDEMLLGKCIEGKVVMVTGAGGSIGSELCRQILSLEPSKLILLERSEYALYQLESELVKAHIRTGSVVELIPLLGSVTNRRRLEQVFSTFEVDTVYHAAAYKHVPLVEHNPVEGLWNNTYGTWYVAEAAQKAGVSHFILISTDKAVRSTNVMGASKRLSEMVLQAFHKKYSDTSFSMVRFGNVLGSSGSVVPKFREQIKAGGPVTVTHKDITRYFMTIPEAVALVIQAGAMARGGDVFVLDMGESVKILDLARQMIHLSGYEVKDDDNPDGDIEIEFTGLRSGEKLFEELLIGNNPIGTEHPKIMRAEEEMIPWDELEQILLQIQKSMEAFDLDMVKQLIRDTAHGYAPEGEIKDFVWKEIASRENQLNPPPKAIH